MKRYRVIDLPVNLIVSSSNDKATAIRKAYERYANSEPTNLRVERLEMKGVYVLDCEIRVGK